MLQLNNALWQKKQQLLRQWICGALCLILLLTGSPLVLADSGDTLELKMKVGSTIAIINGQQVEIAKPYIDHTTTMVPLGVFKKAFGSTVTLENSDEIKISYGKHTVRLTIDSQVAWINGKKVNLDAVPTMKSDTLMVPLSIVAQGLGASLKNSPTGEITVSLISEENSIEVVELNLDSDLGKTKIGNSFYDWSMNYPSGLIVGSSGSYESIATFNDAEDSYYLEVHANQQEIELEAEDILRQLVADAKAAGEVVLDRESFSQELVPYARIVTKDYDGMIWETRAYYDINDEQLYSLYFADFQAVNYRDVSKYTAFLDSFRTTYNTQDRSMRDLSSVVNGLRNSYNEDYGISLDVPAEWYMDVENMYYADEEGSYLSIQVSTAPKASSLELWSEQIKSWLSETFVPASYKIAGTSHINVAGNEALVLEVHTNYGDGWNKEYKVMLEQDGFRYYFDYSVPHNQTDGLNKFKEIMNSIAIEYEVVSETFGRMEEDTLLIDKTKVIKKGSKTYQYKVNIPQFWVPSADQFETSFVEYQFTGGRFTIETELDTSVEEVVKEWTNIYNDVAKNKDAVISRTIEDTTFAGVSAKLFKVHQVMNDIPFHVNLYVFNHEGLTYTITTTLNDANATELHKSALENTLKSFVLTK
ncbi:stalk domain-containing protein [Paenibacillus crassostreae]|uniref:Copper amine oxidase-like N-terminal domain-containing protein n=1 Tax=Paenibacillus crassostreae TaxID=1763538 RepID=A0A167E2L9_9BACL|nr:stalk domain-containing protein [Paenibacillus crassostreae]AOZ93287.1 hypothetical protein LPB68_14420 [Paenibacillus crassostreae]OAB75068.1 hypothetical protein PNBC_09515 [Paenibacillus crassostreae]